MEKPSERHTPIGQGSVYLRAQPALMAAYEEDRASAKKIETRIIEKKLNWLEHQAPTAFPPEIFAPLLVEAAKQSGTMTSSAASFADARMAAVSRLRPAG